MGLVFSNPNHAQEAKFLTEEGKAIVEFNATIDGINPPNYSSWLVGSAEEYQDNHVAIHQARLAFIQQQGVTERRLVQEIIAKRPKEVLVTE